MRILAGIVTHNRRELLRRCVDAVKTQTRAPDGLVVIDNGSNDGTDEMLAGLGVFSIRQENVGSAGGWHRAIQHAIDENYDAVWLMDDDGFPDSAALGILEKSLDPEMACVSSVVVREDEASRFVFPFPILDANGQPAILRFPRKIRSLPELLGYSGCGVYPFVHLFNGALISAAAIRAAGNVDRDFFIFGDEVDYFFRLRAVGKVVSILDARHFHPDVSKRPYSSVKVYYYTKNSIVLNRRYFNMSAVRSILTLMAALGRTANRNGWRVAASYVVGRNASVLGRAIVRGMRGQIGQDFDG